MKNKVIRLFGLLMTFALVACLTGFSAASDKGTCSAETSILKWTAIEVPDVEDYQLYPGTDIGPMAVTSDGAAIFAAVYNENSGNWSLLKSVDGGYTWKTTGLDAARTAQSDATEIVAIEVSPKWSTDDSVYVATNNSVYKSKDRGNTFTVMPSVSGTITSIDAGLDSDGIVRLVVGTTTQVYLLDSGEWVSQAIDTYPVLAVALSPNYASSAVIVAVVNSSSKTVVRTKVGTEAWSALIRDGVIQDQNSSDFVSYRACIGFTSDYNGAGNRSLFVGLSAAGPRGDVFRIDGSLTAEDSGVTVVTDLNVRGNVSSTDPTETNIWSMAVSGNSITNAAIVVGTESVIRSSTPSQAQALLYASSTGGSSWSTASKPLTGATHATVVVTSAYAYVGTGGIQSAVSVAPMGAFNSWNQRGLIDTSIDEITDIAPSSSYFTDNTLYITTLNSTTNNASLWRTFSGGQTWDRIYCTTLLYNSSNPADGFEFNLVKIFGDTVVIAENGGTVIKPSSDQGATFGYTYYAPVSISAFALGSNSSTYYIGGANGNVRKIVGGSWAAAPIGSSIPLADTVVDIVVLNDDVYAGTNQGGVYTAPGGALDEFDRAGVGHPEIPGAAGDVVTVVPDPYDEGFIYAGITGGAAHQGIWRLDSADDEAVWEQIADGTDVGNISSLACAADNGILYAISSTDGKGYRCVRPTSILETPVFEKIDGGLSGTNSVKKCLRLVSGSNLLFAIGGTSNTQIWTTSDKLIQPKLLAPANGAVTGNVWQSGAQLGRARVTLNWEKVTDATSYEVQIAVDKGFDTVLVSSYFESGSQYTTSTMAIANLWINSSYYWRMRVNAPYMSQWSDAWSFITPLGPASNLPCLISPTAGQQDVIFKPVLQWNGSSSVVGYELILAEGCDLAHPVLDFTGDKKLGPGTAYQLAIELKPSTNYCWKVRGVGDSTSTPWSDTGTFTTKATPVVAEAEGGPEWWIWVIITLSVILLAGVIVLVFKTRH